MLRFLYPPLHLLHSPNYFSVALVTTLSQRHAMSSSAFPPESLRQIVQEVATLLKERKETISVAETV
jgi:hypothetical protein